MSKPLFTVLLLALATGWLAACGRRPEPPPAARGDAPAGAAVSSPAASAAPAPAGSTAARAAGSVLRIAPPALSGSTGVTDARYETTYRDTVLEELRERDESWQAEQDKQTGDIRKAQKERKKKDRLEHRSLISSLPAELRPASVDDFKQQIWHQPPVAQYYTGTCWAFAGTSLLESEVYRLTQKKVRLSEMATVYWEYLAKAGRFVRERGDSYFNEGSEANAVTRIWQEHGAWPLAAFPGFVEDERHDHQRLYRELDHLLQLVKDRGLWDEQATRAMLQVILDRHLGRPPAQLTFEGKQLSPADFVRALKIVPDDYVSLMSTLSVPFYKQGKLDVPDNWWHDESYYNVPLDELYGALKGAITAGYSLVIAVDVSEPGKDAASDVMFVPDYDIPPSRIDQLAREYRFVHKVTTDDHGIHVVGHTEHGGYDWFLAKDSGRSARRGKYEGYYFVRGDYIRLKVLAFMVHKDAVQALLAKFKG